MMLALTHTAVLVVKITTFPGRVFTAAVGAPAGWRDLCHPPLYGKWKL